MNNTEVFPYLGFMFMAGALNQQPRKITKPERFEFKASSEFKESLFKAAARFGLDASEFAREAIEVALEKIHGGATLRDLRGAIIVDDPGLNTARVPVLAAYASCGPFKEAVAAAEGHITLSPDVAAMLFYADGDVFVSASGSSMQAAGIVDGQQVLMTPLAPHQRPRRGDIILVQIIKSDGEVFESTIKRYNGEKNGVPVLIDGEDEEIELPEGAERVVPVAVGKSVMGRL